MKPSTHHVAFIESSVGTLRALADESALLALHFPDHAKDPGVPTGCTDSDSGHPVLERLTHQLAEYFRGDRSRFDIPLAPRGTDFQQSVWRALLEIPEGKTRTYGELARNLGRPRAVRAVGAANGCNPISILIPCHRVIGAGGRLTGYAGGLGRKKWLLEHEKTRVLRGKEDPSLPSPLA